MKTVGAEIHEEWWVPAKDLEVLDDHLVGLIGVIREFHPWQWLSIAPWTIE